MKKTTEKGDADPTLSNRMLKIFKKLTYSNREIGLIFYTGFIHTPENQITANFFFQQVNFRMTGNSFAFEARHEI
ncbi:hypothetical protein M153_646000454 [Pseudoloma neurophilia]|uniref:Uncharacterized protein n=1 Tax=Pseudoloma neurophilia TaxID=146866 RepID=A0A0R0M2L4_9MICR|nr:hypothetical protein M153_646000454 [Pseudoloma neurophilia]